MKNASGFVSEDCGGLSALHRLLDASRREKAHSIDGAPGLWNRVEFEISHRVVLAPGEIFIKEGFQMKTLKKSLVHLLFIALSISLVSATVAQAKNGAGSGRTTIGADLGDNWTLGVGQPTHGKPKIPAQSQGWDLGMNITPLPASPAPRPLRTQRA
jgi:hypothetical protein